MSFGHTILAIGGLILLSTFTISLNGSIMQNQVVLTQSEAILEAVAIGQKFIEEAETKRFDESITATIPSSFTPAASLGPDAGETRATYDDLDDYDGYSYSDAVSGYVPFTITTSVDYVTLASPNTPTTTRTYFKRLSIAIVSPALSALPNNTMTINRLFAYHYFFTD